MSRTGVSHTQKEVEADSPRIKEYRTLGRTGFKVSDLGTGDFDDVGPFRGLLDAGVNYIDTSESYGQHGIPVNTIMRYDHYFVAQGREKHAMAKYAALKSKKADRCQDCAGYCESTCPYGVPVRALLATAHSTLTMG